MGDAFTIFPLGDSSPIVINLMNYLSIWGFPIYHYIEECTNISLFLFPQFSAPLPSSPAPVPRLRQLGAPEVGQRRVAAREHLRDDVLRAVPVGNPGDPLGRLGKGGDFM